MKIYALSDPHLSFSDPKPMDVFGSRWQNHTSRMEASWHETVQADDIVLLPGDISWAMRLSEALPDLEWISRLPGRKVLIRGNHDYWWASVAKMKKLALPDMYYIHNSHVMIDGVAIGGSRLWDYPDISWPLLSNESDTAWKTTKSLSVDRAHDDPERIRAHEIQRLSMSLEQLPATAALKICMTHFPPVGADGMPTTLTNIIHGFGIDVCVYGHIHDYSEIQRPGEDITINNTRYILTSSDRIGHVPVCIATL